MSDYVVRTVEWLAKNFVGTMQMKAMLEGLKGEERKFFAEMLEHWARIADRMPKTYETDEQGDEAVAHLHYFTGDCDWYITERDCEDEQLQAFGLVKGFEVELGYINIKEILEVGAELDLYWTPKSIGELKKELQSA